jgi:hypothetical protein
LNPAAYINPSPGTYGNVGTNNVKGPGYLQIDVSLSRTFSIRENQRLQIRAEAFNVPNHLNPSAPNTALNSPNFGKITSDISVSKGGLASGPSAGDPRVIQFALKYIF